MISIITIVKSDRRIARLLKTVQTISKPEKTEVLVVDASMGALNDIKKAYPFSHGIPFFNKTKKKTTIPEQRNTGIKHAKGDIIVFIDSDCIPQKDWLVRITEPIRNKQEYIVAGKVELHDSNSLHTIAQTENTKEKYVLEAPTMNFAIKKEVYEKTGLYNESFRFGSDVDLCWRANKAGYKILFEKRAVIYHDIGSYKNDLRRMYDYGKARIKLYRNNPYRIKFLFGNELLTIFYPLYIFFLPLAIWYPWYLLGVIIPIVRYYKHQPVQLVIKKTFYGTGVLKALILPD